MRLYLASPPPLGEILFPEGNLPHCKLGNILISCGNISGFFISHLPSNIGEIFFPEGNFHTVNKDYFFLLKIRENNISCRKSDTL
jgi:hypothetical protein